MKKLFSASTLKRKIKIFWFINSKDSNPWQLEELFTRKEINILKHYLKEKGWNCNIKEHALHIKNKMHLPSWNMVGKVFELYKMKGYDLPFKIVGCVEYC